MIIAAYLMGDGVYLHRQIPPAQPDEPGELQVIHVPPTDARWVGAAEAVQHFAASDDPLPDLTE